MSLCLVRGSRPGQERAGEGHIHTAVTRTVVNLVPLQGAQSPVVGAQIAKAHGSVCIQGSPQEKVLIPHFALRPGENSTLGQSVSANDIIVGHVGITMK